jgi:D-arginine dehydrogenase
MDGYDVAIVGAGIAGAALAWRLAPRARVLLLEREAHPGMHSTGRSAAMFMTSYGPPQARALTRASRETYARPPAELCERPLLADRGVLYVAWDGQQPALDATARELAATATAIDRIDAPAALARVPVLRAEGLIGALAEPDAMDIDVAALHQGFLRSARRQGATLVCDAELAAAEREREGWSLRSADGRAWRAATLVDAAGAWADAVAALAGVAPVGLQPKRRSAFTFTPPPGADHRRWPTVVAIDESWYFKPDAGALLGSPANADPVAPHDVVAEELDIALGIAGITGHTTIAIRRPLRTWAGLRTFAADGELVIGWDPAVPGFFWLAGQGGYGIQSAAGAALLAAALWRGDALPEPLVAQGVDPTAMSPARFRPAAPRGEGDR